MGDSKAVVNDNANAIQSTLEYLASMAMEKANLSAAGSAMISPAIWTTNYLTDNKTPGATDVTLWGIGLIPGLGAAAALTGIVKGVADDRAKRNIREATMAEPEKVRGGIFGIEVESMPFVSACKVAGRGCTVWRHPNGAWLGIRDAKGRFVVDYKPARSVEVIRPILPLERTPSGDFRYGYYAR